MPNWFKNDFKDIFTESTYLWQNNVNNILPQKDDQVWSEKYHSYVRWEKHEKFKMATSNLYRAAVVYQPKRAVDANGEDKTPPAVLVVEPKHILATSLDVAKGLIFRDVPAEYINKADDLVVLVKEF